MNALLLGAGDQTAHLLETSAPFLLIDDGAIADVFLDTIPRARLFDPAQHSFNPLRGMDYKRARDFASALYTASPEGKDTLTVRNGKRAVARVLLDKPKSLDSLRVDTTVPGNQEALDTINDVLLSPVLRQVLCQPTNFSFKGAIVARLDRAELGDFDAFLLASLLVQQHKGQVIVPDFGFYGRDFYVSLIRQQRLSVGLQSLSELSPKLQQAVLSIKDKIPLHCTHADALVLAEYQGLIPDTVGHGDFVREAMGLTA